MLRITSAKNQAHARSYYQKADESYHSKDAQKAGNWYGKAAPKLGLFSRADEEDYIALIDNLHPMTQQKLTARNVPNRRPLYDFYFDGGCKDVSILYALGKDDRIAQAMLQCVVETMAIAEQDVMVQSRDAEGRHIKRRIGNWVYTPWKHETSRPLEDGTVDCHLHYHATVMNAGLDPVTGQWRALELRAVKENASYYQAIYHSKLVARLQDLGYDVHRKDDGSIGIVGISDEMVRKFSRRTAVIEQAARDRGLTDDPKRKAELGALTRESKNTATLTKEEQEAEWRSRLSREELVTIIGTVEQARSRSLERSEHEPASRKTSDKQHAGSRGHRQNETLANPDLEQLALELGLRHALERKSVATDREVLAYALNHAVLDRLDHRRLQQMLDADPRLIRSEIHYRKFITLPEVVEEEKALIKFVIDGHNKHRPLAPRYRPRDPRLSDEQRQAIRHVLDESRDTVIGLIGRSGTGKTTILREIVDGIEETGKPVMLLAPTAKAARKVLRQAGFDKADTISTFLVNEPLQEKYRNGVLVVDEAGLVSSQQMARVFELSEKLNARTLLVADTQQHRPVLRGDCMKNLIESGALPVATVSQIRRQQNELYRSAIVRLAEGNVAGALDYFDQMGAIHEIDDDSRHAVLVEQYLSSVKQGRSVLIIAPTHREIDDVTQTLRERLIAEGKIRNPRVLPVLDRVDMTEAQRQSLASYHEGQVLQFVRPAPGKKAGERYEVVEVTRRGVVVKDAKDRESLVDVAKHSDRFHVFEKDELSVGVGDRLLITLNGRSDSHRLCNGDLYTVTGVDADGRIKLEGGMTLAPDWQHVKHGYAVSSHTSQGTSVDVVLLAMGDVSLVASSLEQFYVSTSRGREDIHVYTHDREALFDAVQGSERRMSALELLKQRETAGERESEIEMDTEPEIVVEPKPEPVTPLKLEREEEPTRTRDHFGRHPRPRNPLTQVNETQRERRREKEREQELERA